MRRSTLPAIALLTAIAACQPTATDTDGETLARQYCTTCHAYPSPDLLDKATWEQTVLPRMGYMLGFYDKAHPRSRLIADDAGGKLVEAAQVFPASPVLSKAKWEQIQAFYLSLAPAAPLADSVLPVVQVGLPIFDVEIPAYRLSPPNTTMVQLIGEELYVGDASANKLLVFDRHLSLQRAANVRTGAVQADLRPDGLWITSMGQFSPTDEPTGEVAVLPVVAGATPFVAATGLQRPVHTSFADLDSDGRTDLIISEFGKWVGRLSWWRQQADGSFERRVVAQRTGAIRTACTDLNADGLTDIIALFGQGDEGISAFYNQGGGNFREERVLRFSPSHGSSFFQLIDFNADGLPDLLYTCGDAADFDPIHKKYHGIYLFQNKGNFQFDAAPSFFYPLSGAYKAVVNDFDSDGDADLAAISFFPDFAQSPHTGFVYLENTGKGNLVARTFDQVIQGRWMVMDAGDVDGDGDMDIVLGSLAMEVPRAPLLARQWAAEGIPFVLLRNQTR